MVQWNKNTEVNVLGGKTSNESKAKYNAKAYDRIIISVKKGHKEEIQAAADAAGLSVNKFCSMAIDEKIERATSPNSNTAE